jgi:class 3 adenylate cyclase
MREKKQMVASGGAPLAGPLTTLLVTDVQNSTVLWDSLPSEVMDMAYNCHHTCVRKLLAKSGGYEVNETCS